MSGILGNKKNPLSGKSTNKRLVPMPRQLNKHLLNPVSVLFIWQSLFQKSGSLAYTIARIGEWPLSSANAGWEKPTRIERIRRTRQPWRPAAGSRT